MLTPADEMYHVNKKTFKVPFVCGCRNLGEALRRINEGAAMIRTKGEAGTGDVVNAVKHARSVTSEIRKVQIMTEEELFVYAKDIQAPFHLLKETARLGRLPVVNFAAGGVATPADAAMMMQLGMDGVFVGSVSNATTTLHPRSAHTCEPSSSSLIFFPQGIFKSGDPAKRAKAIVQAVTHYNNPKILAEVSTGLGEAMVGINCDSLHDKERFEKRGW